MKKNIVFLICTIILSILLITSLVKYHELNYQYKKKNEQVDDMFQHHLEEFSVELPTAFMDSVSEYGKECHYNCAMSSLLCASEFAKYTTYNSDIGNLQTSLHLLYTFMQEDRYEKGIEKYSVDLYDNLQILVHKPLDEEASKNVQNIVKKIQDYNGE